jgi:hypothetical protein
MISNSSSSKRKSSEIDTNLEEIKKIDINSDSDNDSDVDDFGFSKASVPLRPLIVLRKDTRIVCNGTIFFECPNGFCESSTFCSECLILLIEIKKNITNFWDGKCFESLNELISNQFHILERIQWRDTDQAEYYSTIKKWDPMGTNNISVRYNNLENIENISDEEKNESKNIKAEIPLNKDTLSNLNISDDLFYDHPKDLCYICKYDCNCPIYSDEGKRICKNCKTRNPNIPKKIYPDRYKSPNNIANLNDIQGEKMYVITVTRASRFFTSPPLHSHLALWKMLCRKNGKSGRWNGRKVADIEQLGSKIPGNGKIIWTAEAHGCGTCMGSIIASGGRSPPASTDSAALHQTSNV